MQQPAVPAATRHRAVQDVTRWFEFSHLPEGTLRDVSATIAQAAKDVLALVGADDPELTRGLHKLVEAKDCLVRAAIASRDDGA